MITATAATADAALTAADAAHGYVCEKRIGEGSFGRGSGFLVQAEAEGSPYVCVTPPMAGSVPDFFAPSGLLDSSSGKLPASMQQQQNAALGAASSAVRAGVADEQEPPPPKALLAAKTTRGRGLATALVLLALGSAGAVLVARHLAKRK